MWRHTTKVAAAQALVLALGCGSSGAPSAGDDAGGAAMPGPAAAELAIGPIDLAPGEEKTVCIVKRLVNTEDVVVTGMTAELGAGSHHLIVYRTTATAEMLTPTSCSPF